MRKKSYDREYFQLRSTKTVKQGKETKRVTQAWRFTNEDECEKWLN